MHRKLKDVYFCFVVLFSGLSISFYRSKEGLIILLIVGLLLFINTLPTYPKRLLILSLGTWICYFTLNSIIIGSFHPFFLGTYIAKIIIAWLLLSHYRENIFVQYEKVIFPLTIVSLFFYAWQVVNGSSLLALLNALDLSQNLFPDAKYASISIFTFNQSAVIDEFPRNAGFTWEPGPFSCYIVLAIFFNLIRNNLKLTDTMRLCVFIIALITTQSTTGLLALFVLILWYSWARSEKVTFVKLIPIITALAFVTIIFANVNFIQTKIVNESRQDLHNIISNSVDYNKYYNPGRFVGLKLGWEDLKNYPFAGIGGNVSLSYGRQHGAEVNTINGFANILARYGIIGLLIFVFLLINSSKALCLIFKYRGKLIFALLLIIISFSFGIIEEPIIFTFLMSSVYFIKPYYNQT